MGYGYLGRYTLCTKSKKKDKGSNSHRKKWCVIKKMGKYNTTVLTGLIFKIGEVCKPFDNLKSSNNYLNLPAYDIRAVRLGSCCSSGFQSAEQMQYGSSLTALRSVPLGSTYTAATTWFETTALRSVPLGSIHTALGNLDSILNFFEQNSQL